MLVVVATAALAMGVALGRVETERDVVAHRWQPASVQSRALLTSLVNQENGQRGFILTRDDSFLAPYHSGGRAFRQTLAALQHRFSGDSQMTAALRDVQTAASRWQQHSAAPEIAARRSGRLDPTRQLVLARR